MTAKYYFCFRFNQITLQNDIQKRLSDNIHFQIELIKSNRSAWHTQTIPFNPNPEGEIKIRGESIRFTLAYRPKQPSKEICEIRLLKIIGGASKLLGSYQFQLSSYITANKHLHRSCIEMRVEIGEDFIMDYVVYMQSTQEALNKIVQEHETAKQFHMLSNQNHSQAQFLPEQIHHQNCEDQYQQMQDQLPNLPITRRRFSTRRKRQTSIESRLKSPNTNAKKTSYSLQKDTKDQMIFRKLKKSTSLFTDNTWNTVVKQRLNARERKISNIMEQEVENFLQREGNENNEDQIQHLYDVIGSTSKIIISAKTAEDETISPLLKQTQASPLLKQTQTITFQPVSTTTQPNHGWVDLKKCAFLCLVLLIVLIFVGRIPSNSKGSKRKMQRHKSHYAKIYG